jgi:cache 3/cache 2 fusion protein
MQFPQWMATRLSKGIGVALVLVLSGAVMAFAAAGKTAPPTAQGGGKIEASIFSYDGKDFVRTTTTLMTEQGASAMNTKLDHDTPAFKALAAKKSYTGDATVFGKKYSANYAPLTGADGKLTGALFVGVAK